MIREHEARTGSVNTGGVSRKKILTAYKEQALLTARLLQENRPLRAEDVKKLGGPPNAGTILGRNVLGWFDREMEEGGRRYLYRPNAKALAALEEYGEVLERGE